jgi:2-polyprenyl-3-methyl-5-hydroxy-6-metoxy-1,4-benzoquinol methylase
MSDPVGQAWADELAGRAYDTAPDAAFLRRFTRSPYIRRIAAYGFQPRGARVLEPGCGSGKFSLALAGLGAQVTVLILCRPCWQTCGARRGKARGRSTLPRAAWKACPLRTGHSIWR